MNEMNLLNVQQLIEFNTTQMIWKTKHGLAPEYISGYIYIVPVQFIIILPAKLNMAFTQSKRTRALALEAFHITGASYGIAFLRIFKLQHVSLILRKRLQISSKESRM